MLTGHVPVFARRGCTTSCHTCLGCIVHPYVHMGLMLHRERWKPLDWCGCSVVTAQSWVLGAATPPHHTAPHGRAFGCPWGLDLALGPWCCVWLSGCELPWFARARVAHKSCLCCIIACIWRYLQPPENVGNPRSMPTLLFHMRETSTQGTSHQVHGSPRQPSVIASSCA